MALNPFRVTGSSLQLSRGLKDNHVLSFRDIVAVKSGCSEPDVDSFSHVWKPMNMADPNITLILVPGSIVRHQWFRKFQPTHIALFLDEPAAFKKALDEKLQSRAELV